MTTTHVYAVEWTACERVYCVDGEEHHREQTGVALSRRHVVRSAATSDYEVIEVVELVASPDLGSRHAPPARDRAAAGRRRERRRTP